MTLNLNENFDRTHQRWKKENIDFSLLEGDLLTNRNRKQKIYSEQLLENSAHNFEWRHDYADYLWCFVVNFGIIKSSLPMKVYKRELSQ